MIFGGQDAYAWINRYTGPYWYTGVFPVFVYLLATQSLWVARFRFSKYWRLAFGVLLVITTFFDKILVWFSGLQNSRDSVFRGMIYQSPLLHMQSIVIYSLIVGVGYCIMREK